MAYCDERIVTSEEIRLEAEIERLQALSQNNAHSWDKMVLERDKLRTALTKIAAFDDVLGNHTLEQSGSYGGFDEPGSVQIAREALDSCK